MGERGEFLVLARLHLLGAVLGDLVAFSPGFDLEFVALDIDFARAGFRFFEPGRGSFQLRVEVPAFEREVGEFFFEGLESLVLFLNDKQLFDRLEHRGWRVWRGGASLAMGFVGAWGIVRILLWRRMGSNKQFGSFVLEAEENDKSYRIDRAGAAD